MSERRRNQVSQYDSQFSWKRNIKREKAEIKERQANYLKHGRSAEAKKLDRKMEKLNKNA